MFDCLKHSQTKVGCIIRKPKYYGIFVDSTPDLGCCEQLCRSIKYVDVVFTSKKCMIRKAFLNHIEVHANDATNLKNLIL